MILHTNHRKPLKRNATPNYQESKIYKIYSTVNDGIYVGSTTRKLSERMAEHRKPCNTKRHSHLPIYKAFIEFGVESFFIELIENAHAMIKKS